MKKKLLGVSANMFLLAQALLPVSVSAQATDDVCRQIGSDIGGCDPDALNSTVETIAETLIFLVGAVSVVVLIIAGLMYVTSAGNPEQTKRAKDAIIYAVVGLVVAILAFAIVNFVLGQFNI